MGLADDFRGLLRTLPDEWAVARFAIRFSDPTSAARASSLLANVHAGRSGDTVRFGVDRREGDAALRALGRLDRQGLRGTIELLGSQTVHEGPRLQAPARHTAFASQWDAAVAELPSDWSDVYGEVELLSSDHLQRAALLLSPVNPARDPGRPVFRFRCARTFGYGAAQEMVRRCLERLDAVDIRGRVRILHSLADTKPWSTQGPVWYVGGRSV